MRRPRHGGEVGCLRDGPARNTTRLACGSRWRGLAVSLESRRTRGDVPGACPAVRRQHHEPRGSGRDRRAPRLGSCPMTSRLRYCLVDVFTDRPLGGNPLCVILDPCPPQLMQRIAREANLSETTFPVQTTENAYEMRIFTPTVELPFAGHPSLGTAWLLGPGRWTQTTSGGTAIVEADQRGAKMTQPRPEFVPIEDRADEVLATLGLSSADAIIRSTAGGTTHVLVATSEPLGELDPDPGTVAQTSRSCEAHTLVPFP